MTDMSEYNPYNVDDSVEPEFMPTKPTQPEKSEKNQSGQIRTVDKIISIVYASVLLALTVLTLIFVLAGGSAFNIWLLKSYIDGIPIELDEAALVDGANRFQVFYKIVLPLATPQLAVLFLFSFIATYSEYVITSIFLQTPGKMTLALGLQSFISDQFAAHWTLFSAAAVISSIPIMAVFMGLQKFIQNGLVAGGVKG